MPKHSWQFNALGTNWEIVSEKVITGQVRREIKRFIDKYDQTFSRFRSDALIRELYESSQEVTFPDYTETLFSFYEELGELTDWQFSPLVGEVLEAAGYNGTYTLKPNSTIPAVPHYPKVIKRTGATLRASNPVVFDVGAAGKGFLVDMLGGQLHRAGYANFVIDASGDMRFFGNTTERVGLENPFDTSQVIGAVQMHHRALAASGINRRAWGDWHHIINTKSSRPVGGVIATWVIADSALIADGIATALFFVEPQQLYSRYTYEYLRIHANGSIEYSDYFKEGIFT